MPRVVEENQQVRSIGPVRADLHAEGTAHQCRVQGALTADVIYQCSRCLEDAEQTLHVPFEESFTDLPAKENEDVHLVEQDEIVLDPYVEEAINLALDYCPVCAENCLGLCPVCGRNRNQDPCDCVVQRVDPRLAALQDLLSSDESK
ncbi:hypothetical protein GCM10025857_04480 [Alicyclobacillus contaminans]|nr:hypothetical protein GCM10025857_04480 [Alicyclobacillus contaminans]